MLTWAIAAALSCTPPQIEPAATVGVAELISMRDISGLSLSPDETRAVFQVQQADVERDDYRSAWCLVDFATGNIRELSDGGTIAMPVLAGLGRRTGMWMTLQPRWTSDGRAVAMLVRRDGRTALQTCELRRMRCRLFMTSGDVEDLVWSGDGRGILFTSTPSDAERAAARSDEGDLGYRFDDRFDVFHALFPLRGFETNRDVRYIDVSAGRERSAHAQEIERFQTYRRSPISTTMGAGRSATLFASAPVTRPAFLSGRDVRDFIRLENDWAAWTEPSFPDAAGSAPPLTLFASHESRDVRCGAPECEGYIVELAARNETSVLFIRREGWGLSRHGLYIWDIDTNTVRSLLVTDDVIRVCAPRRTDAICLHEGPTRPRRIVSIEYDSGAVRTLVDANPALPEAAFAPAQKLEWRSPQGDELFGYYLTPPDVRGPHPLIIVQYRASGFLRGGVGDEYPIQGFVRAGFAVLALERPDPIALRAVVRDGDEIDRREWEGLSERRRTLAALTSGIDRIVEMGIADRARVGVTGLSDGAETAVFGLIHCACIAAAAISSGVHDPMSYYLTSDRQREAMRLYGRGPDDIQFWDELSLSRNADRVAAPILAQVADREALFMLQAQRTFFDLGKPFDLFVFPDEYHVKWRPRHRLAIYQRSLRWFEFWLMQRENEGPAFGGEYARWRAWSALLAQSDASREIAQPGLNTQ
ncbi:MAG: Atxe2 family lasso peptide isopeptidase [Hyphomonadaceae bacterium]|nr:Atxe2 family lasso peptide isopeptidase [Hyphomonadaceae bacterium]